MDNIDHTYYVPIMLTLFIGAVEHFHNLYISNTRLIIKQSDQIQFLVKRLIELNKKIDKLQNEITSFNDSSSAFLSTINEEDDNLEKEDQDFKEKSNVNEVVKEEEDVFEIIEKRLSPVSATNKKSSWLSFIF
jgi:ABC-type transporter Mla subunit MlaD